MINDKLSTNNFGICHMYLRYLLGLETQLHECMAKKSAFSIANLLVEMRSP